MKSAETTNMPRFYRIEETPTLTQLLAEIDAMQAEIMEALFKWIEESLSHKHAVIVAAAAHYHFVRIHPFDDGNGRGARILMNLLFIKKHYAPAIIKTERWRAYLETLGLADAGNLAPFVELVARSLLNTQQIILQDLNENAG